MTLNNQLLSRLVTWAAKDEMRREYPDRAVQLGISTEEDPRLGKWNQNAWGMAQRNGYCHTAFCMAGGAVHLAEDRIPIMTPAGDEWGSEYVIPRDRVPARHQANVQWDILWVDDRDVYALLEENGATRISTSAQGLIGITGHEGDWLFDGSNTIEKVVSYAQAIAEHNGTTLDVPEWVIEEFMHQNRIDMFNEYVYDLVAAN